MIATLCALCACQFETAPIGSSSLDASVVGSGGFDSVSGGPASGGSGTGTGAAGMTGGAEASAGATAGRITGGTDASAGGPIADDAAVPNEAAVDTCTAPPVAVCNPVKNDGCPLGMQCAVNPLASPLAGYCTFSAPMDVGFCFNSGVTESCPPTQTCIGDRCKSLCFCDADCDPRECCVEPLGSFGFKVCGPC